MVLYRDPAIGSLDPLIDRTKFDPDGDVENHINDEYIEKYLEKLTERLPGMENASVPHIVINDDVTFPGSYPDDQFAEYVMEAYNHQE